MNYTGRESSLVVADYQIDLLPPDRAEEAADVFRATLGSRASANSIHYNIDDPTYRIHVATRQMTDEIIGVSTTQLIHDGSGVLFGEEVGAELAYLAVLPKLQDDKTRRVGSNLLRVVEALARAEQLPMVHLESVKSSEQFYIKQGYERYGAPDRKGNPSSSFRKML